MARYYEITLTDPGSGAQRRIWTSYPGGKNDPGALNVEIDLLAGVYAVPLGNSTVTIDGIALADLLQAQQFAGMDIAVKGGMQAGLPLANPSQNGVLIRGQVYQSFGNWVGTDMNLNFVIIPSRYTFDIPGNFVVNWAKGQPLADALAVTLNAAYPGVLIRGQVYQSFGNWVGTDMNLNFVIIPSRYTFDIPGNFIVNWAKGQPLADALAVTLNAAYPGVARVMNIGAHTLGRAEVAHYHTLTQLARWVKSVTKSPNSHGVDIAITSDGQILVTDGSTPGNAVQLAFTDLVGQPKWTDQNLMQFSTVMRADIQVGGLVLMPKGITNAPGIVTTSAEALPSSGLKYKTSFQGQFIVQSVRHVGNFREPDGSQWITTFQAAPQNVG